MSELISKLSSYNLLNYLLPGVLLVVFLEEFTNYSLVQENLVLGVFLYYFFGLIISRIGSLFVEPFFKKIGLLKYSNYQDFSEASKKDPKIEILSEQNNTYRSLVSLFLCFFVLKLFEIIAHNYSVVESLGVSILTVGIFVLLSFSYRKQTNYIVKRISNSLKK